jgi:hypothetical protein
LIVDHSSHVAFTMFKLSLLTCGLALSGGARHRGLDDSQEGSRECKKAQKAWSNHFEAFGEQNVKKIMKDYDQNSEVRLYNHAKGDLEIYNTTKAIKGLFEDLFEQLDTDNDGLSVPVNEQSPRKVRRCDEFFVWKWPKNGIEWATDTYLFRGKKIYRQNIVVQPPPTATLSAADGITFDFEAHAMDTGEDYKPDSVSAAWTNHFDAFGARDVDKILLDYKSDSEIKVHTIQNGEGETEYHKGKGKIRKFFKSLFVQLYECPDFAAPVVEVEDEAKQVFLVWKCPSSGIQLATDTFSFTGNFKIIVQNIVMHLDDLIE